MPLLMGLLSHSDNQLGADALSWSATIAILGDQVVAHVQITGIYVLALAVHYQGMLDSFDSRINTQVVKGGIGRSKFDPILALRPFRIRRKSACRPPV